MTEAIAILILAEDDKLLRQIVTPAVSVVHTFHTLAVAVGIQESAQIANALETSRWLTISQNNILPRSVLESKFLAKIVEFRK